MLRPIGHSQGPVTPRDNINVNTATTSWTTHQATVTSVGAGTITVNANTATYSFVGNRATITLTGGGPADPSDYPRVGVVRVGTRSYGDDPTVNGRPDHNGDRYLDEMNAMGSTDFTVINGQPAISSGRRAAMLDWLTWKAANYPDHKTYQYWIVQETNNSFSGNVHNILVSENGPPGQTINPNSPVPGSSWYARDGQGNLEAVFGSNVAVNITDYVVEDSQNRVYGERYVDTLFPTTHITPYLPLRFDGFFCDVFDHRPRENGLNYSGLSGNDGARGGWDDDGRGEAVADKYRDGHRRAMQRLKDTYPWALAGANSTTWGMGNTNTNPKAILNSKDSNLVHPEYSGLTQMGLAEGLVPFSAGVEPDNTRKSFGTPREAWNQFAYLMRGTIEPRHVLCQFEVEVDTAWINDPVVPGDMSANSMKLARFATAMACQSNGYISITNSNQQYGTTILMDEWGLVNTGTTGLTRKWFGAPVDDALEDREWALAGSGQWIGNATGIYKREYENALALLSFHKPGTNEVPNGAPITGFATIPVQSGGALSDGHIPSGEWKFINGVQDTSVNDGTTITTTSHPNGLRMHYYDGLILEKV